MDKVKLFFTTIILLSFIFAFLSYISKSFELFLIAVLISTGFFVLLFMQLGRVNKVKIFQFLIGDFELIDSKKVNEYIYGLNEIVVYRLYLYITFIILLLLFAVLKDVNPQSLIILGVSLISVGIALSILTFNYSRARDNNIADSIIFSSAKRFFLATIFAILSLLSILIYKSIPVITSTNLIFSPYSFSLAYFQTVVMEITIILIAFLFIKSTRFLIEGFILSIKETIIFDK